jgi:hypothetical protein
MFSCLKSPTALQIPRLTGAYRQLFCEISHVLCFRRKFNSKTRGHENMKRNRPVGGEITNMKVLPMLDHMMLWVARIFAFFALFILSESIQRTLASYHSYDPLLPKIALGFVTFVLIIGTSNLESKIARIYLGGISVILLITDVVRPAWILFPLPNDIRFAPGNLIDLFIPLLGFTTTLCVAIRSPLNFKSTTVPNPVNLVNPV